MAENRNNEKKIDDDEIKKLLNEIKSALTQSLAADGNDNVVESGQTNSNCQASAITVAPQPTENCNLVRYGNGYIDKNSPKYKKWRKNNNTAIRNSRKKKREDMMKMMQDTLKLSNENQLLIKEIEQLIDEFELLTNNLELSEQLQQQFQNILENFSKLKNDKID